MLNPQTATITLDPPNATQFRLKYLYAGNVVAELIEAASYVTAAQYVQTLASLNALVPAGFQGGDLVLLASAINAGGESASTVCPTVVQVINAPATPSAVSVS